jgi:hypothetical protein
MAKVETLRVTLRSYIHLVKVKVQLVLDTTPYVTVNDNGRPLDFPPASFVATTYMRSIFLT